MMGSADRDQWLEIAQAIRAELAKKVQLIPAMNPDEVKTFVDTVREAYQLEINASLFDEALSEHRTWLERRAAYGDF